MPHNQCQSTQQHSTGTHWVINFMISQVHLSPWFFQWSHCVQKHICCHDLEFLLWKLLINLWFGAIFVLNTLHHTQLWPRESPVAREWDSVIFSRGLEICMLLCWEGQGGVQLWCETTASCFQRAASRKFQICCMTMSAMTKTKLQEHLTQKRPGKYSIVFFHILSFVSFTSWHFPVSDSWYNHEEQLWPPEDNTQGPNSI